MAKSLQELAVEVLAVQDACNLCGVLQSAARAAIDLGKHVSGTDARNEHPISVLWADKIAHLTGTQAIGHPTTMRAYTECHRIAESA